MFILCRRGRLVAGSVMRRFFVVGAVFVDWGRGGFGLQAGDFFVAAVELFLLVDDDFVEFFDEFFEVDEAFFDFDETVFHGFSAFRASCGA